jgi:hypothetical protein
VVIGSTSVSGTTVLGTTVTGTTVQGTNGTFTSLTGTTITGTTINAVTVASTTGTFTSLTGTTITGTTINGVTVTATTGSFTSLTGTTTSGTTANFVSGVFTTQVSGTTVTGTTSSFTSGNFTTLSGATATFTSGVLALGTATNPSLSFASDPNTGIYSPGADQVAISTNAVERVEFGTAEVVFNDGGANYDFRIEGDTNSSLFFVDASAETVGIGTTSPGETLSISGNLGIFASTTSTAINSNNGLNTGFVLKYASNLTSVGNNFSQPLAFLTNDTERARIDSSGRVLIGTSTSTNNVGNTNQLFAVVNAGDGQIGGASFTTYGGTTNASTRGNILYYQRSRGTTDGSFTILASGDSIARHLFRGADGTAFRSAAEISAFVDGTPTANTSVPGRLVFSTTADGASSPTERMRISADGTITLGDVGPAQIVNKKTTSQVFSFSGATVNTGKVAYESLCNSTAARFHFSFANPNGVVGSISTNASATAFNTSSDYRLKENVVPLTGAADRLNQLQVHRFNFIADPDTVVDGFIAHEAQAVVPECVTGTKDEVDDEGNPVYQGIDQSKLVPLLTAALQEALQKIEDLEGRLTAAGL